MNIKRKNIALFSTHLEDEYSKTLCKGAMIAAEEMDVNLFIIPGRYFDSNYEDKDGNKKTRVFVRVENFTLPKTAKSESAKKDDEEIATEEEIPF